jgi:hypothetical protein
VIKTLAVGVLDSVSVTVGESVGVFVNVGVGVDINAVISTTVSAAAVFMGLEKAESTISCAPMPGTLDSLGFARAAAETIQNRLNPTAPAVRTVRGPEYSLIFTLTALLLCN